MVQKVVVTANVAYDATSREDAFKKMADHFALLARLEGNGMDTVSLGAKWFTGDLKVDLTPADKA